jgi:hypothetical protein
MKAEVRSAGSSDAGIDAGLAVLNAERRNGN